jgi:hypothetical protein
MSRKMSMPPWRRTPAPMTQGRSRRFHTRSRKVDSKASVAHVKTLSSTLCSNSHSGAEKRSRSSMRRLRATAVPLFQASPRSLAQADRA